MLCLGSHSTQIILGKNGSGGLETNQFLISRITPQGHIIARNLAMIWGSVKMVSRGRDTLAKSLEMHQDIHP